MEADKFPPAKGGRCRRDLLIQLRQFFQIHLQMFLILCPVIRIRLNESRGDPAADILGQNRIQPDMGVAGSRSMTVTLGRLGLRLVRCLPDMLGNFGD